MIASIIPLMRIPEGFPAQQGSANSLVSLMGDVSDAVRTSKNAVDGLDKSIEKFR